jgi:WTAP/Mum2p family
VLFHLSIGGKSLSFVFFSLLAIFPLVLILILEQTLVEEKEKKIKELQDNVAAVNFTASSKLGKMLMAKCRTLQAENEEIGEMASEGKVCSPLFYALCFLSLSFFLLYMLCSVDAYAYLNYNIG